MVSRHANMIPNTIRSVLLMLKLVRFVGMLSFVAISVPKFLTNYKSSNYKRDALEFVHK